MASPAVATEGEAPPATGLAPGTAPVGAESVAPEADAPETDAPETDAPEPRPVVDVAAEPEPPAEQQPVAEATGLPVAGIGGAPGSTMAPSMGPSTASGDGAAAALPVAASEAGGVSEAEAEADTDARMDAARPEAERQAEEAAEADADGADLEGVAPGPQPDAGGELDDPADTADVDDDVAADAAPADSWAGDTPVAASDADGGAATQATPAESAGGGAGTLAADVAADGAAGGPAGPMDAGAGSAASGAAEDIAEDPEPALAPSLAPAERDAGLASIAEAGGAEYGGGGGGGAGAAVPDLPDPPEPAIPDANPEAAIAAVSALPPVRLKAALGAVATAATSDVGGKRDALAASPPTVKRPSGAPRVRARPLAAEAAPPPPPVTARVERVPEGAAVPAPAPEPLPPAPPAPTQQVATPAEPADVQGALGRLPTRDPGLVADAGVPPRVPLEGNADPARVGEQRSELVQAAAELHGQGRRDAAVPMGEGAIYPTVPDETLTATIPTSGGAGAEGAGAAGGSGGDGGTSAGPEGDAVSIIAREKHGPEIGAAMAQAQVAMGERRQEHAEKAAAERAASDDEIHELESENATAQTAERTSAQADVARQRDAWTAEQDRLSEAGRTEAEGVASAGGRAVAAERDSAEAEAGSRIEAGNREASRARAEGEAAAASERARGEREAESGGVLGWLRSRAQAFFDGVRRGIQAAFERARALVRAAIERARSLALAVIERARQAIVAVIRRVGDALIAIGNRLLAGFPALRDRFRAAIQARVAAAEAAVNRLADRLRDGVNAALDALGAALDAALGLLERGLLAAVAAAASVVDRAISAAAAAMQAIGQFAALVRDVAAGPARWIANLAASAVDGIRNHLWQAFRTEVRNWFNARVEELLGVGTSMWGVLRQGGIGLAEVGRMAFEALKAAIPMALVQLLIEKVVSMIVPAAGAVLAIIEGLQAAWGTVSRVITAFSRFFAFLRAVKPGNAGAQFAAALAAAAVVVIDFVANWLLRRLMRPARAVAGRVRAIARRIMRRLRAVGRRAGRAARRAGRAVRRGARRMRGRRQGRRRQDRQRRERQARERLRRGMAAARQYVNRYRGKRVQAAVLRVQLLALRARYRMRALEVRRRGDRWAVFGQVNPSQTEPTDALVGATMTPVRVSAEVEEAPAAAEPYDPEAPGSRTRFGRRMRRELIMHWHGMIAKDPDRKQRYQGYIANIQARGRPTWQQSEAEMAIVRGSMSGLNDPRDQVSYIHGREAGRGRGTVRPDMVGASAAVEVKRYLVRNLSGLLRTVARQVERRRENLPYDMHRQQSVIVDLRGQRVSRDEVARVRSEVARVTRLPLRNIDVVTY